MLQAPSKPLTLAEFLQLPETRLADEYSVSWLRIPFLHSFFKVIDESESALKMFWVVAVVQKGQWCMYLPRGGRKQIISYCFS